MLDADYLFNVADEIVELYEQLNIFGINDICRRLVNAEFQLTGSAEWQYYILQQTGMSREEINKQIAQITKKSEAEIKAIFEEASYESYNADMSVYEKAGLTALPFSQSERMLNILDATYRATLGELHNLTMTTADASQELLINTLNETQWKVATGMQSKSQAVAEAVEKVAADGINVMYGEGVRRSIESVVRMCVTTGINQACSQISLQNCESMGTDLVLTSSHPGARTGDGYKGHVNWQGRVFSLSGNSKKYPSFREACGFGQALGICGINCRHSFLPYIDGVSHNPFERYDSEEDKAKYVNQQKQRRMERDIRTSKRQLQAMQESMNATAETDVRDVLQEKYDRLAYKLRNQKEKYNMFCADNNLVPQPERMKVARFNRSQAQRAAWGAKRYEKIENSESGDILKTLEGKVIGAINKVNEHAPVKLAEWNNEHKDSILEIIYNAPDKIRLATEKYLDSIKIINEKAYGRANINAKGITFNVEKDVVNDKGEWTSLCHEIGHCIDRSVGRVSSRFPEFRTFLVSDFESIANEYQKVYNLNREDAYAEISNALDSGPKYHSISDLIGGITNNECYGGYSHESEYWEKKHALEREAFAHFYEATLRNDAEKLELIKGAFPNAYDMFEKMVEVIIS